MPDVQFPTGATLGSGPLPMTRNAVYIKREWADDWRLVQHLRPIQTEKLLAPSVSQAEFLWPFGAKSESTYPTQKRTALPLALKDYFVKVETVVSGVRSTDFIGVIVDDDLRVHDNQDTYSGEQRIRAYGLEHLLDQVSLHEVWVYDAHGLSKRPFALPLNDRERFGQNYRGNRTATIPIGRTTHAFGSGGTWNNLQFVQYLLAEVAPRGITFNLTGQAGSLSELVIQMRTERQSVKAMLDILIPRQRGHGWHVTWDEAGNIFVDVFNVFNSRLTSITSGDAQFDRNPRQAFIDIGSLGDSYGVEYRVVNKSANRYDRIVVEGEKLKICGTFDMWTGTLTQGWTSSEVEQYALIDLEDAGKNDQLRQADYNRRVFQNFLIPNAWTGLLYDVSVVGKIGDFPSETLTGASTANPYVGLPSIAANGAMNALVVNPTLLHAPACRCLRDLPFQAEGETTDGGAEFQKPLVFIRERSLQDGDMKWNGWFHPVHIPYSGYGVENTGPKVAARVTMLDNGLGFQLSYPVPHVLGLDIGENGTGALQGETNFEPLFSANDIFATLFVQTDRRIRVEYYRNGFDATTAQNTVEFLVDDAEVWYVAPKTVYGTDGNGDILDKQTPNFAQLIRDDRPKLNTVAALAAAWFSQERKTISLTVKGGLVNIVNPGTMLVNINGNQRTEQIGTIVSSVLHDFGQGSGNVEKTVITTGYFEFDPRAIFQYSKLGDFQSVAREIESVRSDLNVVREHVSALPVRESPAGGGAAASSSAEVTSNILVGGWDV